MDGNTALYVGGILAILVCGLLIVRPFFKDENVEFAWELEREMSALEKEKEAVFTTLNEVEFDYETNKLREEDYDNLKKRYQLEAVRILRREKDLSGEEIDDLSDDELEARLMSDIDLEIEKELAKKLKERDE